MSIPVDGPTPASPSPEGEEARGTTSSPLLDNPPPPQIAPRQAEITPEPAPIPQPPTRSRNYVNDLRNLGRVLGVALATSPTLGVGTALHVPFKELAPLLALTFFCGYYVGGCLAERVGTPGIDEEAAYVREMINQGLNPNRPPSPTYSEAPSDESD